jgi:hypothetical protein
MPRLLRGVARTAVVAGTATAVSNRVARRQGNRWARQHDAAAYQEQQYQQQYQQPVAQYVPVAAPAPEPDPVTQLQQLADLRAQGALTDAEFEVQKARILAL